jgi:hypothetical protein
MQLEELTGDERTLVVVALQALCRERLTAIKSRLRKDAAAGKSCAWKISGLREA